MMKLKKAIELAEGAYNVFLNIEHRRGQLDDARKVESYSLAEELASSARHNAREHKQTLCEINALITRSAVRIDLARTVEAREDLEGALALNKESNSSQTGNMANPKVEALARLCWSGNESCKARTNSSKIKPHRSKTRRLILSGPGIFFKMKGFGIVHSPACKFS
jgi:hypothetical protein